MLHTKRDTKHEFERLLTFNVKLELFTVYFFSPVGVPTLQRLSTKHNEMTTCIYLFFNSKPEMNCFLFKQRVIYCCIQSLKTAV